MAITKNAGESDADFLKRRIAAKEVNADGTPITAIVDVKAAGGSNPVVNRAKAIRDKRRADKGSKLTSKITKEVVEKLDYKPLTDSVASEGQLSEVAEAFAALGVTDAEMPVVALQIARRAADSSSSNVQNFEESASTAKEISLTDLLTAIRNVTTLRRFCAFYAPDVWNSMLLDDFPPANWDKKGFLFSERFAAFDFFYGVESKAAHYTDGLVRNPSDAERLANHSIMEVKMFRIEDAKSTSAGTVAEVTGGKARERPSLNIH
nr:coat protein [Wheat virus Q]